MQSALREIGIPSDESFANFILTRFENPTMAEAADAYLQTRGLVVRNVAGYGLPTCLRITIGDEIACRAVASALADFMKGARA